MNPDQPLDPRAELEIRITALLMGQLPPEEAAALEAQIAADPELSAWRDQLRRAAELLREARALPESPTAAAPTHLSKERREHLLATFRGIKPLPTPQPVPRQPAAPRRAERKWVRPVVLAASIAILITAGSVFITRESAYLAGGASEQSGQESDASGAAQHWYFAEGNERYARASGMSDPKGPSLLGSMPAPAEAAARPEVSLAMRGAGDTAGWKSQLGVAPTVAAAASNVRNYNLSSGENLSTITTSTTAPAAKPASRATVYLPSLANNEGGASREAAAGAKQAMAGGAGPRERLPELTVSLADAEKSPAPNRYLEADGEVKTRRKQEVTKGNASNTLAPEIGTELYARGTKAPDDLFNLGRFGGGMELDAFAEQPQGRPQVKQAEKKLEPAGKDSTVADLALAFQKEEAPKGAKPQDFDALSAMGETLSVQPMETKPLSRQPGDSTIIADQKNNRVVVVDPKAVEERVSEVLEKQDQPQAPGEGALAQGKFNDFMIPPDLGAASENTFWDTADGLASAVRSKSGRGELVLEGRKATDEGARTTVEFEGFINDGSRIAATAQAQPSVSGGSESKITLLSDEAPVEDLFGLGLQGSDARFGSTVSDPLNTAGIVRLDRVLNPTPKPEAPKPEAALLPAQTAAPATPAGAPASGPENGVDPAQETFVGAFLDVRKAEEQKAAGDRQKALEMYRGAAEKLAEVKQQWPKWQPELLEYRLKRTQEAIASTEAELAKAPAEQLKSLEQAGIAAKSPASAEEPAPPVKAKEPPPVPQPEIATKENAFSTFSLNVSDVSFELAAASLEKGQMPEPAAIRNEEFINAFNYRDPEPAPRAPLAFLSERARYPFAHNRDLLRLSLKTAAAGREAGRPLNLVLLLDNSGSMERSDRARILQESLRVLSQQLQPQDKLSIITFSRSPRLWADGVAGDKAAEHTQRVTEITPEGGTDLSAALKLGYETALRHYGAQSINRVVLLTDGAANLGEVKPETLREKVEAHRKQGIALDCFGVGWEGYNDDLLEQLSRNGDGRYGFINSVEEAGTEFAGQLAGALRVAASDVKVQVEFNPRRVVAYRQIGYAKHQLKKEQFRDNTVDAAEIGAAESGNALYAIEVNPRGEGDIATVRARFKTPGAALYHEHEWTVPFGAPAPAMEQASSSLRLAATAGAFSEWLAQSPFAGEVTSDRLLGILQGIPAIYGADQRPAKLESMIRQARSISGR